MKTIANLKTALNNGQSRSAWSKGVKEYALELISDMDDSMEFYGSPADKKMVLNGADDWTQYSEGGCSLIYNGDICERLCSPSIQKKTRNGERNPNSRENWIDCQSRALRQAYNLIVKMSRD